MVAGGSFEAVYNSGKQLSTVKAEQFWKLTCPVKERLNQRYLGELPNPQSGLAIVKSAKGSGKTTRLRKLISEADSTGRRTLLLTHRIVLGQAICDAVGIP